MITIVLMFSSVSWPGNGELWVAPVPYASSTIISVSWFKSVPVPRLAEGARSRRRMIVKVWHGVLCVSIRGQTLLFQIITYCCGKMALSPQLLKLSSFSITRRTKLMFDNNKAICSLAQAMFYELIILTCKNSACIMVASIWRPFNVLFLV